MEPRISLSAATHT